MNLTFGNFVQSLYILIAHGVSRKQIKVSEMYNALILLCNIKLKAVPCI
jgi:hypothetical protein